VPGIAKHFKDRYHLQDWRVGHVELAIRHRAPVVPVGVVGAEEQMPQIGRIPIQVAGLPFIPITLTPVPCPCATTSSTAPHPRPRGLPPRAGRRSRRRARGRRRVKAAVQALVDQGLSERTGIFA